MPDPVPDYYNKLLEQRRSEYASKELSKMPADFLANATRYLQGLRDLLDKEIRENPTSRKVEVTRATYQRATASARDVLEARLSKIAQQAALHVNLGGQPANLLPEERALYDALTRELAGFRRAQAPFLEPPVNAEGSSASRSSAAPPPISPASPAVAPPPPSTAPAPGSTPPRAAASSPTLSAIPFPLPGPAGIPRQVDAPPTALPPAPVVVRVLEDGKALAIGKESLELRKHDLLTLPPDTAQLLIHARKVERVETGPRPQVT